MSFLDALVGSEINTAQYIFLLLEARDKVQLVQCLISMISKFGTTVILALVMVAESYTHDYIISSIIKIIILISIFKIKSRNAVRSEIVFCWPCGLLCSLI